MLSTFFSELKILESSLVLVTLYMRNLDMLKCLLWYGIVWSSFNLIAFPMTLSHEKVWSRVWDCRSFFGIVGLFLVNLEASTRFGFWEITGAPCTVTLGAAAVTTIYIAPLEMSASISVRGWMKWFFFLFNCLYSMQIIGKSQRAQS